MLNTPIDEVLGVPVDSLGKPGGTELAPAAMRATGLIDRLHARDLGDLPVNIRRSGRDDATGILAYQSFLAATHSIREGLAPSLRKGRRVLLLGGCCASVPGTLAALADATDRPVGLAYIDGHLDLYDGHTSPTGEAADMPLAQALGHGDPAIVKCGPRSPLITSDALALLGFRDLVQAAQDGSLLPRDLAGDPLVADASRLLSAGPAMTGTRAAARLRERCSSFHLHIDVDVLSTDAFPATPPEYYQPGGLTVEDLVALARPLASSPACRSVGVACYDPELDSDDRQCAARLARALELILTNAQQPA